MNKILRTKILAIFTATLLVATYSLSLWFLLVEKGKYALILIIVGLSLGLILLFALIASLLFKKE